MKQPMSLKGLTAASLLVPVLNLQYFAEPDELATKMGLALEELKKFGERQEAETKKFGDATAETKTSIEKINDDLDTMRKEMTELATKAARAYEPQTQKTEADKKGMERKAAFIKYLREGKLTLTPEEKAILSDVGNEVKALVEDSTGEIIVPEDLDRELYRAKMEDVVLRQLAFVRPTTSNRVKRNGLNEVTAGWGKLETAASKSLVNFESTLTPNEAYIYVENLMGLTKIGEDELMDSAVNLEQYLVQSFRDVFRLTESAGFLRGTGHANEQPDGILMDANIATHTTGAVGTVSADDMINLMYKVKSAAYRNRGVFLINTELERQLRLLKDDNGQYLWQQSLVAGVPSVFNGRQVYVEDSFEEFGSGKKQAVFGDFKSGYQIVDRQGLAIVRLGEKYIENDLIGFRAKQRVGGGVVRPAALATLTIQ